MSYPMVMLLLHFEPYTSFKLFCNLIITRRFLYKTYLMDWKFMNKVNDCLEELITLYFYDLYMLLKALKVHLWNFSWIEWVLTIFMRTFELETVLVLWDFILVKGDRFFFKIFYSIFKVINEYFLEIDRKNMCIEIKNLLIKK